MRNFGDLTPKCGIGMLTCPSTQRRSVCAEGVLYGWNGVWTMILQ